jgi:chromosome segregation ATPase
MPPKKAAGGKGKGTAPVDPVVEEKKQTLFTLLRQCDAVERMMVICSEQIQRSQLESLNIKKRIAELNQKFEEQEKHTNDKCSQMYKMYKSGQSQLVARIEAHETTIDDLRKQLDEARVQLEQTKAEKDMELAERTRKINEQKQKMEEMAIAFGVKLKETLEQMSYHIHGRDDK